MKDPNNGLIKKLVKIDRPLLRVSQLAIHLNRQVNEKGLLLNKQTHMPPIFALINGELGGSCPLKKLMSIELDVKYEDIIGLELSLFDLQKGTLSGLNNEFVHTARLDNLASCHAALTALEEGAGDDRSQEEELATDQGVDQGGQGARQGRARA